MSSDLNGDFKSPPEAGTEGKEESFIVETLGIRIDAAESFTNTGESMVMGLIKELGKEANTNDR